MLPSRINSDWKSSATTDTGDPKKDATQPVPLSWADRMAQARILTLVLRRAAADPRHRLDLDDIADIDRLFGGAPGVVTALRERWRRHLAVKIEQAAVHGRSAFDAHRDLVAEQPALHSILVRYRHG